MILTIEEVKPGMVLAEAVRNHQDQLLLSAGLKVTDKTIRVFKSWGIRQVAVRSEASEEGDHPNPGASGGRVDLDQNLNARFAEVIHDPIMVEIMHAAGRQLGILNSKKRFRDGRG